MELIWVDYVIIIAYFAIALAVGLFFARRAGNSLEEYIVSGHPHRSSYLYHPL